MNPRLFCREQSYHKALLLTYSFDPIFFEQVVLHDLWAGRSSDILVLGDKAQNQTATQAAAGQLWHLGKRYLLAGADISGAFHPKLFLRLGPKDGLVMLGSGNVTSSGWGGNQELGTAWMVGPDHVDKGVWLHPFLDDVLGWCGSELARDAVRRIKDVPWLSLTPAASSASAPVLHSRQGRALATDLAQRWAGRQFDEVRFSPAQRMRPARSYDGRTPRSVSSGPPLHSRHRRRVSCQTSWRTFRSTCASFLRRQARCCTPSCIGSWAQGVLAAVMGSANCSAAAWLLSPDKGGNVESVVIYDRGTAEDFEAPLRLLSVPGQAPAEVLLPRATHEVEQVAGTQRFVLKSLSWDGTSRRLQAELAPTPGPGASVELLLGGRRLAMTRSHEAGAYWACELTEGLDSATVFASASVALGFDRWTTPPRWIDDVAALEHASHAARLLEPFKGLDRHASSAEQRQLLDDLQEVAQALFSDPASFRAPQLWGGS